jgi:hypothetical protein
MFPRIKFSWKVSTFSPPVEREAYLMAKANSSDASAETFDKLKKLLMQRAVHSIPHILKLQNEGPAIDRMYKKGLLTDDKMGELKEMKAFVEQEFADVQTEANELLEGWGDNIWPQAFKFHTVVHDRLNGKETDEETDDVLDGSTPEEKKEQNKPAIDPKLKGKSPEEISEHYANQLLKQEEAEAKKKTKKPQGKK